VLKDMNITKRPWGRFLTFAKNKTCTVKVLEVNAGQSLSLQRHKHREEHWYFLEPGVVQLGKKRWSVPAGTEIVIKKNQEHRLLAEKKTRVLEVSFGWFSEKDEERIDDIYARR